MKFFRTVKLSIVVVIYNMEHETPKTLFSLSSEYQHAVGENDYEVIVIDNGSASPFPKDYVKEFGANFRYYYLQEAPPSPCAAINFGVRKAKGQFVGIMIDGARILSPGVIKYTLKALNMYPNPIVSTLGFHLGPDVQMRSILQGYNKQVEKQLLEKIDWPHHGYRLFEISCFADSSGPGWFDNIAESNCFFLKKTIFKHIGGYDERFDLPGGGLANLDIYTRLLEIPELTLVTIFGEGNFHQLHGGVATNGSAEKNVDLWSKYEAQYRAIRGKAYRLPKKVQECLGHVPHEALKSILLSAEKVVRK